MGNKWKVAEENQMFQKRVERSGEKKKPLKVCHSLTSDQGNRASI